MKKLLLIAALFLIGSFSLKASFKNDVIETQIRWNSQSQWGILLRVDPESRKDYAPGGPYSGSPSSATEWYVPVIDTKYDTMGSSDLNQKLAAQSITGYVLNPILIKIDSLATGLDPSFEGYIPYDVALNKIFVEMNKGCATGKAQYGTPKGKCTQYQSLIDPYLFISNITSSISVKTFALFPCNKYGSTTKAYQYFSDAYSWPKEFQGAMCENGFYSSLDGGKSQSGWYKYDFSLHVNPFMRFAAAIANENEDFLTMSSVNSAAEILFKDFDVNGAEYFDTFFVVYYSNDTQAVKDVTPLYNVHTKQYDVPKGAW